jgi:hypothetical protein
LLLLLLLLLLNVIRVGGAHDAIGMALEASYFLIVVLPSNQVKPMGALEIGHPSQSRRYQLQ